MIYLYSYSYICIDIDLFYFKELAHKIMGTGMSRICWTGWQAKNSGKSYCCGLEA